MYVLNHGLADELTAEAAAQVLELSICRSCNFDEGCVDGRAWGSPV